MKIKQFLIVLASSLCAITAMAGNYASPGNHILDWAGKTFTTNNPASCKGVVFPQTISTTTKIDASNQIQDNKMKPGTSCSTYYQSKGGSFFVVSLQDSIQDGAISISAYSYPSLSVKTAVSGPNVIVTFDPGKEK